MTEIARREEPTAELVLTNNGAAGELLAWAESARAATAIAKSLSRTPFVPASLRDRNDPDITTANVTAALLTGSELGLSPMASMRSIDLIQGVPALRAITLRAVVLAHGHQLWVEESTASRAIVKGRRAGTTEVQTSTWTIDRARALGLLGRDQWKRQPTAMLIARATAECARLIAADAILGIGYVAEELADGADDETADATVVERAAAPRRTAQRRTRGQQAIARPPVDVESAPELPEPAFDDELAATEREATAPEPAVSEPVDAEEVDDVPMVSDKQLKKIATVYTSLGISDRDQRLTDVTEFLGRDLDSSKELTRDEATRLIDDLERRASTRDGSPAADESEPDPCPVCGADDAKNEPHDADLHEMAES